MFDRNEFNGTTGSGVFRSFFARFAKFFTPGFFTGFFFGVFVFFAFSFFFFFGFEGFDFLARL